MLEGLSTVEWNNRARDGNKRKADLYDIRVALKSKGTRSAVLRPMERQLMGRGDKGKPGYVCRSRARKEGS